MEDAMTLTEQSAAFAALPATSRRPVRIYAIIVGVVGADPLLVPGMIASLAFVNPQLAAMPAITWLLRGLGLSCVALGCLLWLLSRARAVRYAPFLGFAAGACTLALLGIGWGHLTLLGMAWLLLVAATDIGCGLWMRWALRGQD
jgi:hypothetical protein